MMIAFLMKCNYTLSIVYYAELHRITVLAYDFFLLGVAKSMGLEKSLTTET